VLVLNCDGNRRFGRWRTQRPPAPPLRPHSAGCWQAVDGGRPCRYRLDRRPAAGPKGGETSIRRPPRSA